MPRATTGVTPESVTRFLVDAGAVYLNYGLPDERLLGATRGGAVFEVSQEIRTIDIDGSKGATMGARRVTSVESKLTAKVLEMSTENILLSMAGSRATKTNDTGAVGTTHDEITRSENITLADFHQNVAIVATKMGTNENFVGIIKNALSDGGFKIETGDKDEAVVEIQFTGHFDPANMDLEPWLIRNPVTA